MGKKATNKQVINNQVVNPETSAAETVETSTTETVETSAAETVETSAAETVETKKPTLAEQLAASLTVIARELGYSHGVILLRQTEKRNYHRFIGGRIKSPNPQKLLTAIVRARLNVSIVDEKYNALTCIQKAGITLDGAKSILNYSVAAYVNGDGKVNPDTIFVVGGDCKTLRQATSLSNKQRKDFADILHDANCMIDGKLNFNAPRVKDFVDTIVKVYYAKISHTFEAIEATIQAMDLEKVDNSIAEKEISSKGAA